MHCTGISLELQRFPCNLNNFMGYSSISQNLQHFGNNSTGAYHPLQVGIRGGLTPACQESLNRSSSPRRFSSFKLSLYGGVIYPSAKSLMLYASSHPPGETQPSASASSTARKNTADRTTVLLVGGGVRFSAWFLFLSADLGLFYFRQIGIR